MVRAFGRRAAALLLILVLIPAATVAETTLSAAERAELELELEEARAQLDEAAARLGDLHRRLYTMETVGLPGQKPMLGVLVGERGPNGGLLLAGITPGGGAEAAGLQAGDELVRVGGRDLTAAGSAMAVLKEAMAGVLPGEPVSVAFRRGDEHRSVDVTTQARGLFIMNMAGTPGVEIDVESLHDAASAFSGKWVDAVASLENLESLEALQTHSAVAASSGLAGDTGPAGVLHRTVRIAGPNGLRLEHVSGDLADYFGVESGVLVMAAPADEEAPLKAGDILLAVDGELIRHPGDGYRLLMGAPAANGRAEELTVEVMRHGVRELVRTTRAQLGSGISSISIHRAVPGEVEVQAISPPPPP